MRIVAFITETARCGGFSPTTGEPAAPLRIAPARGPSAWEDRLAPLPDWDALAQTAPQIKFDQRVSW
jgi:hypothetical protein